MERVLILGCSGGGKSTFARSLGKATGLPVIHLDQHYWRPGWQQTDKATWRAQVVQLCAQPQWIMDGNYAGTLDLRLLTADAVILIDMPRWRCIVRVLRRAVAWHGRARPDLAPGCPEQFSWELLRFVWAFPTAIMPETLRLLRERNVPFVTLRSDAEMAAYLESHSRG